MEKITEERIKLIIHEHLGVPAEQVIDSAALVDLGADSLDTVELTMAFEEEFGIMVEDDMLGKIKTVLDCIALVYELT